MARPINGVLRCTAANKAERLSAVASLVRDLEIHTLFGNVGRCAFGDAGVCIVSGSETAPPLYAGDIYEFAEPTVPQSIWVIFDTLGDGVVWRGTVD